MLNLILSFALSIASASEPIARDVDGYLVTLGGGARPQVLVFWSPECPSCLDDVPVLQAAGIEVVLISENAAGVRSTLRPTLRARGLEATLVADPAGTLRQRFGLPSGEAMVLVDSRGAETLRQLPGARDVLAVTRAARELTADAAPGR